VTSTSAGTTIALTSAAPATLDETGYAALALTLIGGVESIAPFGAQTAVNSFQPLAGAQEKHKGASNYGTLQLPIALDTADAGQALLQVAAAPGNDAAYSVRIMFPNGDMRFFRARVFGFQETPGSATSVLMGSALVEIITPIVKIDGDLGGTLLDLSSPLNLLLLGDLL
jgi:hypothetical protein